MAPTAWEQKQVDDERARTEARAARDERAATLRMTLAGFALDLEHLAQLASEQCGSHRVSRLHRKVIARWWVAAGHPLDVLARAFGEPEETVRALATETLWASEITVGYEVAMAPAP